MEIDPGAVIMGEDGFYRVDYRRLGIRMLEWTEWLQTSSAARAVPTPSKGQFWATAG